MSTELMNFQGHSVAVPIVQQTGDKNVNVNNQPGGIINFNYNINPERHVDSAEKMMAIRGFSKEYYQLIVTNDPDVFSNHVVTVSQDRALSQNLVPPEIYDRCSSLSEEGIAELKTFPAIVCMENTEYHGLTDSRQLAVYCYIKLIKKTGRNIKVAFQPIDVFYQTKMCDEKNAIYFDLNMDCALTDLNSSAWSVHKVNLFDAFDAAGITNMVRPY